MTQVNELPEMDDSNFFHSRQLFEIAKQTPRQKPYMVLAINHEKRILAHLLGIVRYRS